MAEPIVVLFQKECYPHIFFTVLNEVIRVNGDLCPKMILNVATAVKVSKKIQPNEIPIFFECC